MFAIGGSLREARERQGLDLNDAEAATKVRVKYLRALEDERFELLPGQTYVKGFLRTYADYLGLDGQLYVDEFNSRFASGEDDLLPPARAARPRPRTGGRQVETTVVLVALAGIAAVTALVVVAWKWGGSSNEPTTLVRPPASPEPQRGPVTNTKEWAALDVRATRGDSWILVRRRSATGKTLWKGVLARGEERRFTGPKLYVLVGDPQNLAVRLRGKATRLPANRHRLLVTPRRIRPATA